MSDENIIRIDTIQAREPVLLQYGDEDQPVYEIADQRDWPLKHNIVFSEGASVLQKYQSLLATGKVAREMTADEGRKVLMMLRTIGANMPDDQLLTYDELPQPVQLKFFEYYSNVMNERRKEEKAK